ncbi:hypothetical protein CBOM_08077 [Ceraceosorus bombacis]|uniref:Uncharacterized protein n=1 Tax=Ceraceosorus bombacis TaxID=401625 RepID=A0A0P1BRC2_9BASI|nr:hypothetical protein CBOM_08077 [Ceraceosorus bombacis]
MSRSLLHISCCIVHSSDRRLAITHIDIRLLARLSSKSCVVTSFRFLTVSLDHPRLQGGVGSVLKCNMNARHK